MRVTLVSPFDPTPDPSQDGDGHVGGVERVFSRLSRELADRGHEVRVLCSTDDGDGHREAVDGFEVVRQPRAGTLFRDPVVNLAGRVDADADVVHVAATYPFTTPAVLRKADKLGVASVLDFHFEPKPNSLLGRVAAGVYRRLATPTYRRADAVLVNSREYARTAPSLERVPEDRWHELPNGIDPDRFHPRGPTPEGDYMLFVGRLVPYKGLEVLLEALSGADVDLPLRIAGDGPLREELKQRAGELDVDAEFLGYVPGEDLPDLYRGAEVTVLPSVNQQEAFGIALLESMACGTPVVASGLPGVAQVASRGGLVAEPRDPGDLRARLEEALEPGRLPSGPELAERVHAEFSWEAVGERLESIYEATLDERSPTARGETPSASSS